MGWTRGDRCPQVGMHVGLSDCQGLGTRTPESVLHGQWVSVHWGRVGCCPLGIC